MDGDLLQPGQEVFGSEHFPLVLFVECPVEHCIAELVPQVLGPRPHLATG